MIRTGCDVFEYSIDWKKDVLKSKTKKRKKKMTQEIQTEEDFNNFIKNELPIGKKK